MGTAVSKRKNLRSDAISSVAAKVRAARAFGEYLSQTHPETSSGSDHLLSDAFTGQDSDSTDTSCPHNNNNILQPRLGPPSTTPGLSKSQPSLPLPVPPSKRRLSLEPCFSAKEEQQKCAECAQQPACVYTITGEGGMLGPRGSKESLELEVLKGARQQPQLGPASTLQASPPSQHHRHHGNQQGSTTGHHQGGGGGHHHHHHHGHQPGQPLQSSVSAHNIRSWGEGKGGPPEDCTLGCEACSGASSQSQRSLDLEGSSREAAEDGVSNWFPKENMFSFQTATTTMQAISNFRKHLRMVGSRRMKAQTFADRRPKSFSRSWSDPTPVKPDPPHDSKDSGELQAPCGMLEEGVCNDLDWDEERELERVACEGDDFIPPKIMLISSKVPKAEYVPTIIRRDDPSIIPILYDHEHATFDDILEEIDKKLTAYRRGCKIWRMLLFCQGGPGHLYLLKNKVATFAKVEKEEDMSQFWKRLSRFMSKLNPEPNLIHIMGCYVLGNPNGEKLFQKLKNLMRPYSVDFESPLELSAQGKEMIEMYFDFRLFRLWKTRQHSKLLDYDDLL
ncbi:NMDA receptor synaptonuclear signaling and neuronal migration factor [Brienomyrus brachyistius]|uniref:NMDA receptor synaptonuclear signaling and neuronal migration factor n=1 Tax=Brienomyrus brachyistius TaxID=42636 RepID=UPI0020B2C11C|nr:NMDA receptor synaptonuclear signaling and neuronal migration factor [Brienomyrus brachyistius]